MSQFIGNTLATIRGRHEEIPVIRLTSHSRAKRITTVNNVRAILELGEQEQEQDAVSSTPDMVACVATVAV